MGRLIPCPLPGLNGVDENGRPLHYITLPDEWLGVHANRRDKALEQSIEKGNGGTVTNFAIAMSLLDDWNLPGLQGNPENWDFGKVKLSLIGWVNTAVLPDYTKCFVVPKNSFAPLPNGQTAQATTETDGNSETAVL